MSGITAHYHGCAYSSSEKLLQEVLQEVLRVLQELLQEKSFEEFTDKLEKLKVKLQDIDGEKKAEDPDPLFVFVDKTNFRLRGASELQELGLKGVDFDLLRLVKTVLNGREASEVYIVGSHNARDEEYSVEVDGIRCTCINFERIKGRKEKKVDGELTCCIMDVIRKNKRPGTIVLVSGDADYDRSLLRAENNKWKVEVHFWNNGMSKELRRRKHVSLINFYENFTYMYIDSNKCSGYKYTLQIRGAIVKDWKHDKGPVLECFGVCKLLCQLRSMNDTTICFYFKDLNKLKMVENWLSEKYPDKLKFKRIK